jgi:hypothetical protein
MLTLCKSMVLGAAFLAGVAIAANSAPLCRTPTGPCQPPGPQIAAPTASNAAPAPDSVTLPEVTVLAPYSSRGVGPRVSSFGTIRTEHYQLPPDYEANVALHPYTSRLGPCLHGTQTPCEFLPRTITISAR